jgi:2-octaprenylphenol hydroxylase
MHAESTDFYDVIIVGAGLVGAALACTLAQQPAAAVLRIAVIEAGGEPASFSGEHFDPRVVALTHASQHLLEKIGCWEAIVTARACAYGDMKVWDGEGTAHIDFSSSEVRATHLGHIVENSVAVQALRARINQLPQITFIQPASVVVVEKPNTKNARVTIQLNGAGQLNATRELQASLLIAADGAHSAVRDLAGFTTREWDYGQQAIVTTVRTEQPHQFTAWQRFMPTGPLAFLPLQNAGDAHQCSIVWSAETELAQQLMSLDDEAFCAQLGRAFEYRLGAIERCAERFCIPLRQRHARHYIQPGIALIGDAAHNIHPLAGQGVNLGLLDVAALAEEIERALTRSVPLHDLSILHRYQRQRLTGNLLMMGAMEGFKQLFGSRSLAVTLLRNTGMREMNSLPLLKNFIVKQVMG